MVLKFFLCLEKLRDLDGNIFMSKQNEYMREYKQWLLNKNIQCIDNRIVKIRLDCMIGMICCLFCIGFCSGYSICNKNFHGI